MHFPALLFDIGNTTLKIGMADEKGIRSSYSLPSTSTETADSLGLKLLEICRHANLAPSGLECCLACSVVPSFDPVLATACQRYLGLPLRFTPRDLPIPLENRYQRPQEVGADRLATAFAGRALYSAPTVIVVDFGTATTFDCVQDNAYLGGLICPGLLSSASALSTRTAKLPQVSLELDSPELSVGRSTSHSLNQGLIFGFAAMAEGLIQRLKKTLQRPGEAFFVVGTGGLANAVAQASDCFDAIRPDLLLEGLRRLLQRTEPER
jgi:type III pantothenate kinase